MVASRNQLLDFLVSQWNIEKHHSVRNVLFSKACELFSSEPGSNTWELITYMINTLTEKQTSNISEVIHLIPHVPDYYIQDFVELTLKLIDRLIPTSNWYYRTLSDNITCTVSDHLSEELNKELLRRFFFMPVDNRVNKYTPFALDTYLVCSQEKFEHRMKIFADMFVEAFKYGWDVPLQNQKRHFPTNYGLRVFVNDVLCEKLPQMEQFLDGFMKVFVTTVSPLMEPTSYLQLVYEKEHISVKTPTDFGIKVGKKLPQLIDLFSPVFLYFMADVLDEYSARVLYLDHDSEDTKLCVIEGLVKVGSIEAELIAAKLLRSVDIVNFVDRFDNLIKKFKEHSSPAIKSIAYDIISRLGPGDESLF